MSGAVQCETRGNFGTQKWVKTLHRFEPLNSFHPISFSDYKDLKIS